MKEFKFFRGINNRVFIIPIGNLPSDAVDAYVRALQRRLQETPPTIDREQLRHNLLNINEDIYIPQR